MNSKEVIEYLDQFDLVDSKWDGQYDSDKLKEELHCEYLPDDISIKLKEDVGEYDIVNTVGGGEGGGEYVELVVHFKEHDVFLKATASYYSHHGIDYWQNWKEVTPKTKTVTYYE